MLKKAAAVLLIGAGTGIWAGCNNTSSRFLYAAIPGANQIVIYREDPNSGVLTQLVGSPIAAGPAVQSVVIHPSKKFLYAANPGVIPGNVSLFTISTGGALTEVTPRTNVGTAPTLLAIDSSGSFLYVSDAGSNDIYVFSIDSSSGALTLVSSFPVGMSPINMALSPSGGVLYLTGAGTPGVIQAFAMNQGAPTVVNGSPFFTGTDPFGLAIDPAGAHLYTGNKLDNSISEFTINSDGSLTQLSNSPLGGDLSGPDALLIDTSGKYLYVANQGLSNGTSNLAGYSIESDGTLTLLSSSPFGTGAEPGFIATDPSGKYIFVGNQASPASVQSFSLAASSGTLTSVQTYSVPGTPTSISVTQ